MSSDLAQPTRAHRNRGSALVQVMIAAGLASGVGLSVIGLLSNLHKGQNSVKFRGDADTLTEEIRTLLSDPAACTNSFRNLFAGAGADHVITTLKDGTAVPGVPVYTNGSTYGDNSLTLRSMRLSGFTPGTTNATGQMTLLTTVATAKAATGSQEINRSVVLNVERDGGNLLTNCVALSRMSDGIWQRSNQGNLRHIFYSPPATGGSVGIGTSTPESILHIADRDRFIVTSLLENEGGPSSVFTSVSLRNYSNVGHGGLNIYRGRGTKTAPNPVLQNDLLGGLGFWGWDGAEWGNQGGNSPPAFVGVYAADDFTPTSARTYMIFGTSQGPLISGSTGQERMRIQPNGDVGIGTNSPTARLHVSAQSTQKALALERSGQILYFDPNDNNTNTVSQIKTSANMAFQLQVNSAAGIGGTSVFYAKPTGEVGIGTTNPTFLLHLGSDSAAKPGTSSWAVASDARLKNIHRPFERGLDALLSLEPIYFHYAPGNPLGLPSDEEYVGVIAQQTAAAVPEAVSRGPNGFFHVTTDSILWTVVNAVKDLHREWLAGRERIEEDIEAIRRENRELKAYICGRDKTAPFCR